MNIDYMVRISKALPENFRTDIFSLDLEACGDLSLKADPPEYFFIQTMVFAEESVTKRKLEEGWLTIGELDYDKDIIFLWDEGYEEYTPIIKDVLKKADLEIPIEKGSSQNYVKYCTCCGYKLIKLS